MSVWGIANPFSTPIQNALGSDTPCPAATLTLVGASPAQIAPQGANAYPFVLGVLAILLGATPPTAMIVTAEIFSVSTFFTYTVPPAVLVANATLMIPIAAFGVSSRSQWVNPGAQIATRVNPTGQAVTMKTVGSALWYGLALGSDV